MVCEVLKYPAESCIFARWAPRAFTHLLWLLVRHFCEFCLDKFLFLSFSFIAMNILTEDHPLSQKTQRFSSIKPCWALCRIALQHCTCCCCSPYGVVPTICFVQLAVDPCWTLLTDNMPPQLDPYSVLFELERSESRLNWLVSIHFKPFVACNYLLNDTSCICQEGYQVQNSYVYGLERKHAEWVNRALSLHHFTIKHRRCRKHVSQWSIRNYHHSS